MRIENGELRINAKFTIFSEMLLHNSKIMPTFVVVKSANAKNPQRHENKTKTL